MFHGLLKKGNPEKVFIWVQADAALAAKTPCAFVMDGTDDGLNCVVANTAGAAKATSLFAGIPNVAIALNAGGWSQVYGVIDDIILVRATRAASTDSYNSNIDIALGDLLNVNTAPSGMVYSAAGAASAALPYCVAAETLASAASSASTTSDSSTAVTTTLKAFLRAM